MVTSYTKKKAATPLVLAELGQIVVELPLPSEYLTDSELLHSS
jgi:hypothetical protein